MQNLMENWNKFILSESSLSRVMEHIQAHDCAVITAFRNDPTDVSSCADKEDAQTMQEEEGAYKNNLKRNRDLKAALLSSGYGVTKVKGTYVENFMEDNAVEVKEDSLFVVNRSDDQGFIDNVTNLGKKFCQDSVLIIPKGGKGAYLYGTNNADFPGLDNKETVGDFGAGREDQFMTRVQGRPFTFKESKDFKLETLSDHSKNSRWAIKLIAERVQKKKICK